jgi:hypothetical protein
MAPEQELHECCFANAHIPTADNAHYVKLRVMTSQDETKVSHPLGTVPSVMALSGGLRLGKSSMMFCRKQVIRI